MFVFSVVSLVLGQLLVFRANERAKVSERKKYSSRGVRGSGETEEESEVGGEKGEDESEKRKSVRGEYTNQWGWRVRDS